jgi:predicted SAM-dependent methyltransferase/predicted  nucleic acid-binding Zn-ribbon protein
MGDYRELINEIIVPTDARILEIGPLNRPLVLKERYPYAVYCDIRDTQQIKDLYSGNDYMKTTGVQVDLDTIVDIDIVLKESYAKTFKGQKKFDFIVASHVLEHVEDLIFVLQDVFTVLADGGKFIIYYPDKRYCFDHFREEASFRDAYDVFLNKRSALARMVLDFFNSAIGESRPYIFWTVERIPELLPLNDTQRAFELYQDSLSGEFMDDVHYWPFSDAGFIKFLYDAVRANLITYSCKEFYPTQENTQEFLVILQNSGTQWNRNQELENLRKLYAKAPVSYYNSLQIQRNLQLSQVATQLDFEKKCTLSLQTELDHTQAQLTDTQTRLADTQAQLAGTQAQLVDSQAQLVDSQAQLLDTQAQLAGTQARLTDAQTQLGGIKTQLADTQAQLAGTQAQLTGTQAQLTGTQAQLLDTQAQLAGTQAQLADTQARLAYTQAHLDNVLTSTSWKITKPIRAIKRTFTKKH